MEPTVWGPHFWFALHSITFNYPFYPSSSHKSHYKTFFESIQFVLPCSVCQEHYKQHWQKYPIEPALESRAALVEWLVELHNAVNESLGKRRWSLAEAVAHYEEAYGHPLMIHPHTTELNQDAATLAIEKGINHRRKMIHAVMVGLTVGVAGLLLWTNWRSVKKSMKHYL